MKVKGQILIYIAIMLNDHSNPYIESTTVLSDNTCLLITIFSTHTVVRIMWKMATTISMLLVALSLCVLLAAGEEVEQQQCPPWHFTPDNANEYSGSYKKMYRM